MKFRSVDSESHNCNDYATKNKDPKRDAARLNRGSTLGGFTFVQTTVNLYMIYAIV